MAVMDTAGAIIYSIGAMALMAVAGIASSPVSLPLAALAAVGGGI